MIGRSRGRIALLLRHLGPAALVVAALLVLDSTTIDSAVSGWFFDPVAGAFPLRYNVAFEAVTHHWTKYVVILVASAVVATLLLSFVIPEYVVLLKGWDHHTAALKAIVAGDAARAEAEIVADITEAAHYLGGLADTTGQLRRPPG